MKQAARAQADSFTDYIIIGGKAVVVDFPVITWRERDGLSFMNKPVWQPRKDPRAVNLIVLHWDGCVSSRQAYNVLLERQLSAHLLLDGDGTIYQTLDLAHASAWHARGANERSIGIEIQNPVTVGKHDAYNSKRGVIREPNVHGSGESEHLDFCDIQKKRVAQLVEFLCCHFNVPRTLPVDESGQVLRTLAPRNFTGVCGHYHLSQNKIDPGLSLWPGLQQQFSGESLEIS